MSPKDEQNKETGTKLDFSELHKRVEEGQTRSIVDDETVQLAHQVANHKKPTPQANTSTQQLNPTDEPNTPDQPTVEPNSWNQQSNSPNQQLEPTDHDGSENEEIFSLISKPNDIHKFFSTNNRKKIQEYLHTNGKHCTSNAIIHAHTGVTIGTIRDVLRELEKAKIISKEPWIKGAERGMLITPLTTIPTPQTNSPNQQLNPTVDKTPLKTIISQKKELTDYSLENEDQKTNPQVEWLANLDQDDVAIYFPNLSTIGFGPLQIKQLLKSCKNPADIPQSLEHADYCVEKNTFKKKDKSPMTDPKEQLTYLMGGLRRSSWWDAPKGYLSVEDRKRRDKVAAEKERLETIKMEKELGFQQKANQLDETQEAALRKLFSNKDKREPGLLGPAFVLVQRYEKEFPDNPLDLPD